MNQTEQPVVVMAGGTGGHIFPALAVAERLRAREIPILWLGSKGGMESRIVVEQGYPIELIAVKGLRGKGRLALLTAPFKLVTALLQALRIVRRARPRAVLGMGGFASGPGGLAAWLLRVPLYIHEQNALPGMTNRLLARFATKVMEGFPGAMQVAGVRQAIFTGNPVRAAFHGIDAADERLSKRAGPLRVLVVGGSLGALKLNLSVPAALAKLPDSIAWEVWHQCGERHLEVTRQAYDEEQLQARIEAFIAEMPQAYAWADLVIARAGALTVTELAQVGVAAILVPYPHAVDDHQTLNARMLVSRGGAKLLADADLSPMTLAPLLEALLRDRRQLLAMALATQDLKRPEAAESVASICLGETNGENNVLSNHSEVLR